MALNDDINEIENHILAIKKNLNQLEEDYIIYNNIQTNEDLINSKNKKENLMNEINDLEKKLSELQEFKNSCNDTLNNIYKSENELIEKKKENNINETKISESNNLINTLYLKINKTFFLLVNWIEIYFGNNDIIFNKEDIPQIKDLNFINFDLLVDCLEKKRIIINSNLTKLIERYKDLKSEIVLIKKKINECEKNNDNLKKEKEKCEIEKNNLDEEINNLHMKFKLFNDYNTYNQNENKNIFKIKNESLNTAHDLLILKKKIENLNKYNDELKTKIKDIKNAKIYLNNNYNNKINNIKNELNVKKVERELTMNNYNNKFNEYENENNKIKMEIEILKIKIKNIETELEIKNNFIDNMLNNYGKLNPNNKNIQNDEKVLINKLKSDNKNLFNENNYITKENALLKQKIEFFINKLKQ